MAFKNFRLKNPDDKPERASRKERKERQERKERLEKILAYINDYIIHPDSTLNDIRGDIIFNIVKIYTDKINFQLNEDTITGRRFEGERYYPLGDFFDDYSKPSAIKLEMPFKISIARDPVLTEIWNPRSHAEALSEVATPTNPWTQQEDHWFSLYLPMGVTVVHNGNHSANCGIIKGEGELTFDFEATGKSKIYDMSHLYKDYYYDGTDFRSKTDKFFRMSGSFESGCIFEIGRVIQKNRMKMSFLDTLKMRNKMIEPGSR